MNYNIGTVRPIRSKTEPIPATHLMPLYNDVRFSHSFAGRTIFLAEGLVTVETNLGDAVEGLTYEHSDIISQDFGWERIGAAREAARAAIGNTNTAAYYEAVLQEVYHDPTAELQHIIAGLEDMGSNFFYHVYGIARDL